MDSTIWVPALLIFIGLVGIVIPVLPGLLLIVAAVALWAYDAPGTAPWVVFGVAALLYATGMLLQYLIPGRKLREAGVRTSTLVLAVLLGVVGFFVVPVLGAFLGFVLGILLVERTRHRDTRAAWSSTRHALKAVLLSVGIELLAGLGIAATWTISVIALS